MGAGRVLATCFAATANAPLVSTDHAQRGPGARAWAQKSGRRRLAESHLLEVVALAAGRRLNRLALGVLVIALLAVPAPAGVAERAADFFVGHCVVGIWEGGKGGVGDGPVEAACLDYRTYYRYSNRAVCEHRGPKHGLKTRISPRRCHRSN